MLSSGKRFKTCLIVLECKINCSRFQDNICGKCNSTFRLVNMYFGSNFPLIYWLNIRPSNSPARKIDTQSCVSTLIEAVNHQPRKCILLSSKWNKEYIKHIFPPLATQNYRQQKWDYLILELAFIFDVLIPIQLQKT